MLYPEHSQLAFDFVIIAYSLDSIRPDLVQGCKAPNVEGSASCLITSSESGLIHWTWSVHLKSAPARTLTYGHTIGPSQATLPLLIDVVLSPHTVMWGVVTNTGYDSMPISLGIVRMQIHCLWQGSVTKQHTSWCPRCPSVSVADITDCATSPALHHQSHSRAQFLRHYSKFWQKCITFILSRIGKSFSDDV